MQLSSVWRSQVPDSLKEVGAKIFQCFNFFDCSQIISYLCQKWKKKLGVTDFVSEVRRVENYSKFEK